MNERTDYVRVRACTGARAPTTRTTNYTMVHLKKNTDPRTR